MIASGKIAPELAETICEEYEAGRASVWMLTVTFPKVGRTAIRELLHSRGLMRPNRSPSPDPSLEEIEARKAEIQRSWTPEEASMRWVGRGSASYLSSLAGE